MDSMLFRRLPALFVLSLGATACAGGFSAPPPSPEEIPSLESALAADPSDADLGLLLASAYRETDQFEEAADVVNGLRQQDPGHTGLLVMDGLLKEDEGELAQARALYREALASAPGNALEDELSRRLELIRQTELRNDVRGALAREAELSDSPDPATVGVFPFAYEGTDPEWEPLSLALAELLVTDLAITGRLRVVERVKVQALIQELALSESGLVEEATAARGGRILGSGHVVQGRYRMTDVGRISVDVAVVKVSSAPGDVAPVTAEDDIARLFDLEKRLALDVHTQLGVSLTPAERARVNERQTESVQALLAFGRGLASSDAGDFEQAEQHFAEAAELDPAFGLATARRALNRSRTGNARRTLQGQAMRTVRKRQAVRAIRNAPASARAQILRHMTQKQRAVLAEVLGQDRLGTSILLELVLRRPGGDQ